MSYIFLDWVRNSELPIVNVFQTLVGLSMSSSPEQFLTDEALNLIAEQRRRQIIRYLKENDNRQISIDDLATCISEDSDRDRGCINFEKRLRVELYHAHLPKLETAGVVDYDEDRDVVSYQSRDHIEDLLEFVMDTFQS